MKLYLRKVASEGINHHVEHCVFVPASHGSPLFPLSYLSCLPPLKFFFGFVVDLMWPLAFFCLLVECLDPTIVEAVGRVAGKRQRKRIGLCNWTFRTPMNPYIYCIVKYSSRLEKRHLEDQVRSTLQVNLFSGCESGTHRVISSVHRCENDAEEHLITIDHV